MTYKELTQFAVNLSVSLAKLGFGVGDIVAVGSEKRNEIIPTILGILFTGATYTPHDLNSGTAVLKHKLTITQPKYFICSNLFWSTHCDVLKSFDCIQIYITLDDDVVESMIPVKTLTAKNVNVDLFEPVRVQGQTDVALILYSSGTTGLPKGVQLTHLNCILNSLADDFKDESFKTVYLYGDWYHNYDTFMTYKFLSLGRRIVYIKDPNPLSFLKCVQDYQVDIAMIVPSLVGYLSKSDEVNNYNLESLKIIYSGSAPLHVKTIDSVKKRLPKLKNILQGYGMTEFGEPTSESWAIKGPKSGSVGMASPGIILRVAPVELEAVLQLHPAVKEAGVVGKPVPDYGEEPTAFVVKQPGFDVTEEELVKFVALEVSPFMQLKGGVRFLEEIPKNSRGKILRRRLRELLSEIL